MGIEKLREQIHKELDGKLSQTETENLLMDVDMFNQEHGYLPEDISEWYDATMSELEEMIDEQENPER